MNHYGIGLHPGGRRLMTPVELRARDLAARMEQARFERHCKAALAALGAIILGLLLAEAIWPAVADGHDLFSLCGRGTASTSLAAGTAQRGLPPPSASISRRGPLAAVVDDDGYVDSRSCSGRGNCHRQPVAAGAAGELVCRAHPMVGKP
jgi:hypothetical protein